MPREGAGVRVRLIYLMGYTHSIIFDGLLGTKQRMGAYICLSQSILRNRNVQVGSIFKSRREGTARLNKHCKTDEGPGPEGLCGFRRRSEFRSPAANCIAGKWRRNTGKSWRAHREIKRYAGGSEHRTVADECVNAAGNGATDESTDTGKPDDSGGTAARGERYDGTAWIAAGSGTEAD